MREHPPLVAFAGAIDTELMAAEPGVVAKIGAEALIAVGTPDGRGLALKILDGSTRALDPAAVLAARELLGLRARHGRARRASPRPRCPTRAARSSGASRRRSTTA